MSRVDLHTAEETFDQWLVLRAQEGDEAALRRLVERWSLRLQRHALRLTGQADAAADVSQEAWLAIVRGLRKLNDPACFRRWAYQIVSRRCADWVRARQRQRATITNLVEEPAAVETPEITDHRIALLQQALAKLASQDRTMLAMHYLEKMSLQEIAEALLIPMGTVKSRLHYSLMRLRRVLENLNDETNSGPKELT